MSRIETIAGYLCRYNICYASRYQGAQLKQLLIPPNDDHSPQYDSTLHQYSFDPPLANSCAPGAQLLTLDSVSRLFYYSMALSAWKQSGGSKWSLRVNPSSGNLHPTEAYLIAGTVPGLTDEGPMVAHYAPK